MMMINAKLKPKLSSRQKSICQNHRNSLQKQYEFTNLGWKNIRKRRKKKIDMIKNDSNYTMEKVTLSCN